MSKNRDLAISATSKIYEKVNTALGKPDADKRWFWELLQNAKDTVVFRPEQSMEFNDRNKKVDIILSLTKFETGETVIKFSHNGNPFRASNHVYKYDDPKCLLLADSGKIEENEYQRDNLTGQFGSGFLSTHILSKKIKVEGVFLSNEHNFYKFAFTLDRKYSNKLELAEKVEKSLDEYDANFNKITNLNEFNTTFTYFLEDNENGLVNGLKIAQNGISAIGDLIPYVLAFANEIRSVTIIDSIFQNTKVTYTRELELSKSPLKNELIQINKNTYSLIENQLIDSNKLFLSTITNSNHTTLAINIVETEKGFKLNDLPETLPALYCTFPLIGSENWRFPVAINNNSFYPEVERNGINLLFEKDHGNRNLIAEALELFLIFCQNLIDSKYENLYWLANTKYVNCPDWCDKEWYEKSLDIIRNGLLDKKIILNSDSEPIKLGEAIFPYCPGESNLSIFYKICIEYLPANIPSLDDLKIWNSLLNVKNSNWNKLKFSIIDLLKDFKTPMTLTEFSVTTFNGSNDQALAWLKDLYTFIYSNLQQKQLFEDYPIVLNQENVFRSLKPLLYDQNIPNVLKDALADISENKRNILIYSGFDIFDFHTPYRVEDVSNLINKHFQAKPLNLDPGFYDAMLRLCSCLPKEKGSEKLTIYDLSCSFLPSQKNHLKIELENYNDFYWANTNKWIIEKIADLVQSKEDIKTLTADLQLNDSTHTIKLLNSFLSFVDGSDEFKPTLSNYRIVPNEKNIFDFIDSLNNDVDLIPEKLKNIFFDLSDGLVDWKTKIISPSIEIKPKNNITLKEFTNALDDFAKEKRDNLKVTGIRDAVLDLIKWVSDNEKEYDINFLFEWFANNKANMYLTITGNSADRDHVFTIIQSGRPLEIIARLVSSNLSDDQITSLIEQPELTQKIIAQILHQEEQMLIVNQLDLIQNGIFNQELGEELNLAKKALHFKSHNFNSSNWEYVKQILMRAFKNVLEHLKKDTRYEFSDEVAFAAAPNTPTVISGVKKNGQHINLVIRPSDGNKVHVYYNSEFKALLLENTEFWIDNGIDEPELLTIGKILKYTETEIIPLIPERQLK